MKILILCTGNSCRSQMAHGFLASMDASLTVRSAGTNPSSQVNPNAVRVMQEAGIDISTHVPQNVECYLNEEWDYVITVCGNAKEACPLFVGNVKNRLHIGFRDPSDCVGEETAVLNEFRTVRDEIRQKFTLFYKNNIFK